MPVGSVLATEPVDKAAHALFVEVAQTLFGSEVRQRVGDQQAPVLAAGAIVDGVMRTAPGVVINPVQRVAVPARRAASFAVARILISRAARNVAAERLRCRPSSR